MKKIISFIIILNLGLFISCASKHSTPESMASFKSSSSWNKLDGRFKQAWTEAVENNDEDRLFEVLLKTARPLSPEEKETLNTAGLAARVVIGRIVTGSVKAEDVPAVADLSFVQTMELAAPMTLKK